MALRPPRRSAPFASVPRAGKQVALSFACASGKDYEYDPSVDFRHWAYDLNGPATAVVTIDRQANVHLLDEYNFQRYRRREGFTYLGGHYTQSPVYIAIPHAGRWHVVVDLGGGSGYLTASCQIV